MAQNAANLQKRFLAEGPGWRVAEVICSCGSQDRPFEEQHTAYAIAVVASGTFEYRSSSGGGLMIPGSLLLGNAGDCFECAHTRGAGDRCISFQYDEEFFRGALDAAHFRTGRIPPVPQLTRLVASATAENANWNDLALLLPGLMEQQQCGGLSAVPHPSAVRSITAIVRAIEEESLTGITVPSLAASAKLSVFHFIRTFQAVTGVTPHQFLLRTRLRNAAIQLRNTSAPVVDVAMNSGFRDLSNFNRSFRAEFGVTPRSFRQGWTPSNLTELSREKSV